VTQNLFVLDRWSDESAGGVVEFREVTYGKDLSAKANTLGF
jgi:hypothetical protein